MKLFGLGLKLWIESRSFFHTLGLFTDEQVNHMIRALTTGPVIIITSKYIKTFKYSSICDRMHSLIVTNRFIILIRLINLAEVLKLTILLEQDVMLKMSIIYEHNMHNSVQEFSNNRDLFHARLYKITRRRGNEENN